MGGLGLFEFLGGWVSNPPPPRRRIFNYMNSRERVHLGQLSRSTITSRTVLFLDYSRWHIMPSWVQPSEISACASQ